MCLLKGDCLRIPPTLKTLVQLEQCKAVSCSSLILIDATVNLAHSFIGYHYLNRQKKTFCQNNQEKWIIFRGISVHGQRYLGYC